MLPLFRSLVCIARRAATVDYSLIAAIVAVAGISAFRAIESKSPGTLGAITASFT